MVDRKTAHRSIVPAVCRHTYSIKEAICPTVTAQKQKLLLRPAYFVQMTLRKQMKELREKKSKNNTISNIIL